MEYFFEYQLLAIGTYTLTVADLLGALLVYILASFFLRLVRRGINRGRILTASDQGRRHSVYLIVQYLVWTMAIVVMLEVIGVHVSVLLAGSAALLVGLGLGLQEIFRDTVSGIFLLFEGTIEVGDVLQLDNVVGKVTEINLRTSKVITRDGMTMIVPNHKFITQNVINWTHREHEPSRFSVNVGVNYLSDENVVREIIQNCAQDHPDLLRDDPNRLPKVRLMDFTDERMVFELIFWTHRKFEVDNVRSDLRFAIREQLTKAGVLMSKTV